MDENPYEPPQAMRRESPNPIRLIWVLGADLRRELRDSGGDALGIDKHLDLGHALLHRVCWERRDDPRKRVTRSRRACNRAGLCATQTSLR